MTLFGTCWQLGRGIAKSYGESYPAWVLIRFNRNGKAVGVSAMREYPPPAIWFMVALGLIRVIPNELEGKDA